MLRCAATAATKVSRWASVMIPAATYWARENTALARLRNAKVGAGTMGGSCPAKREPSRGNFPSTSGCSWVTVALRQAATVRRMASPCARLMAPMTSSLPPSFSCQSRPSALRRISMVCPSASALRKTSPHSRRSFSWTRAQATSPPPPPLSPPCIIIGLSPPRASCRPGRYAPTPARVETLPASRLGPALLPVPRPGPSPGRVARGGRPAPGRCVP